MTRTPAEACAASGVRSREPLGRADRIKIALLAGSVALSMVMLGAGALAYRALSAQILELQQTARGGIAAFRTEARG